MKRTLLIAAAVGVLALLGLPKAAQAQSPPISRTVTITYTGVVSNDAASTIIVHRSDGTSGPYTGPVPAYPLQPGQPVTISFNAVLPTQAFYTSGAYGGPVASDGIYKFTLGSAPYVSGGPGGVGVSSIALFSSGFVPTDNFGQPTNTVATIYYNSNTDTYSIDPGKFVSGAYSGPGYKFDATGQLVSCSGSLDCRIPGSDPVITSFTSNPAQTGDASGSTMQARIPINGSTAIGLFNLNLFGSWNLPTYSGSATAVPEPSMLAMFGASSGLLALRRRRRRDGAAPAAG